MQNYIFIALLLVFLTACEKEVVEPTKEEIVTEEVVTEGQFRNPTMVFSTVSNLNQCVGRFLNPLRTITNSSQFAVGDNSPGTLNYELEQAFDCVSGFSTCNVRLSGTPSVTRVQFILEDNIAPASPYFTYIMSASKAEELKKHLACEIKNYQNTHYRRTISYVKNISVSGDVVTCLCDNSPLMLIATVEYYVY